MLNRLATDSVGITRADITAINSNFTQPSECSTAQGKSMYTLILGQTALLSHDRGIGIGKKPMKWPRNAGSTCKREVQRVTREE